MIPCEGCKESYDFKNRASAWCRTSDGINVNMAEELNRLEKELINGG